MDLSPDQSWGGGEVRGHRIDQLLPDPPKFDPNDLHTTSYLRPGKGGEALRI